ncbi:hypothetical protein JTB14_034970 [Gonioctena quinquepunctata]|nr:hypothetical protein JTB14_034970 [Gonioctena quinquepunctata]
MKIYQELPFEIIDIDEDERKKQFPSLYGSIGVLVGPKKYYVDAAYKQHGLNIYNFQAKKDDVYLIGHPRTGTTLHCEMAWLMGNNLDYEGASKHIVGYRFPHIDFSLFADRFNVEKMPQIGVGNEVLEKLAKEYQMLSLHDLNEREGRRFLKSHLPISLNPPSIFEVGAKVIYCARNPKDVIVSMYHSVLFFSNMMNIVSSFDEFFRMFKNSWGVYLPFFEHVKEAWSRRNDENFLFLFYEDTIKDKKRTIIKMAEFLGKSLSKEEIDTLEEHLNIEKFRKNQSVNFEHLVQFGVASADTSFINKGKLGGWKDYFVGDLEKEVNEWIEDNLKGTDLKFPDV